MQGYRTLLVPHDFSSHADRALEHAVGLARHFGSTLHLLHVVQPPIYATPGFGDAALAMVPDLRTELTAKLRKVADETVDAPSDLGVHVVEGVNVAGAICAAAMELGADLIVMGTHGRTGLQHAFMGSVAERTLRAAPCPVLTVKAREG
jgi:nucleotide-binding universal stress UspA family protein